VASDPTQTFPEIGRTLAAFCRVFSERPGGLWVSLRQTSEPPPRLPLRSYTNKMWKRDGRLERSRGSENDRRAER